MNSKLKVRLLPWMIGSLLAVSSAFAQNTSSSLSGRIVDASGKPVAGATVQIIHTPSGTASTVVTDANGRYNAQGLRVGGPFEVKASGDHGEAADQGDVYLRLAEESTLNLTLTTGSATELTGVTVTANAPGATFQADNKGLSTNVSGRDLKNLPAPNRSIQDIARLDPRIVVTDRGSGAMSAMGQNSRYNNISVDSVGVGDPFGLNANGMPYLGSPVSIDTIEEWNINTANFDVTAKAVGASINAVTKSGTNEFHGSVYYAYQNADDFVGSAGWLSKDNSNYDYHGYDKHWTGGLTLGGPIIKDTLFFFLSYEKEKVTGLGADSVTGLDESLGDGPSTSNKVSPGDLQRIIDIANSLGLRPGSYGASAGDLDDKRILGKLDWNINDSHRASLSWQRTQESQPIVQGNTATSIGLSSYWYTKNSKTTNVALHLFDDWTESFSTETSVSYQKFDQVRSYPFGPQPQVFINLGRDAQGNLNGASPFVDLGTDQYSDYNILHIKSWNGFFAGTYVTGDHSIKGGIDYQQNQIYNLFGRTQFGAYTFWGIDDFAAGNYHDYNLYQPAAGYTLEDVAAKWTYKQWGLFLQDTWQVNDVLSVQYGVRLDIPTTGDTPIYNPTFEQAFGFKNNSTIDGAKLFQPRISFNLDLDGERTAQLRGGFGLFMTNPPTVWMTNPYQNNGITTATYSCSGSTGRNPCRPDDLPFSADPFNQPGSAAVGAMAVDTIAPDFKLPSAWKTSLALDKKLPWWGLVASVEWAHLTTKDGIWYQNLNIGAPTGVLPDGRYTYYSNPTGGPGGGNGARANADPRFQQAVTLLRNTHKGSADSLTFSLKKPFSESWSGNIAATIGRATDVNPGTSSQASSNFSNSEWVNPGADVASPSDGSIRQRLSASLTWQHSFFGDYATAVTAFYDGHTGNPYSWVFGNDMNGDSYSRDLVYIPRVNDPLVMFQNGTSEQAQQQFYDFIQSNGYLKSHQGKIAGRNRSNSPWVNQIDLSFRQEVPGFFPDGAKGELRFDIFNFLNLLNKDWGQQNYVSTFPAARTLANYQGIDPATGKMIYSLPTDRNGNYAPGGMTVYDAGGGSAGGTKTTLVSRWSAMITLRYTF